MLDNDNIDAFLSEDSDPTPAPAPAGGEQPAAEPDDLDRFLNDEDQPGNQPLPAEQPPVRQEKVETEQPPAPAKPEPTEQPKPGEPLSAEEQEQGFAKIYELPAPASAGQQPAAPAAPASSEIAALRAEMESLRAQVAAPAQPPAAVAAPAPQAPAGAAAPNFADAAAKANQYAAQELQKRGYEANDPEVQRLREDLFQHAFSHYSSESLGQFVQSQIETAVGRERQEREGLEMERSALDAARRYGWEGATDDEIGQFAATLLSEAKGLNKGEYLSEQRMRSIAERESQRSMKVEQQYVQRFMKRNPVLQRAFATAIREINAGVPDINPTASAQPARSQGRPGPSTPVPTLGTPEANRLYQEGFSPT